MKNTLARLGLLLCVLFAAVAASPSLPSPAGEIWLESFGCVGDGTANDSTCMTNAVAALTRAAKTGGGTLRLGCGRVYLIGAGSPYVIPAYATILGCGDGSVLKTATNATLIKVGGAETTFRNFKILGNATGASQYGIANALPGSGDTMYHRVRFESITFDSLGQAGLVLYDAVSDSVTGVDYAPVTSNCRFINCPTYGFWNAAQYDTTSNIQVLTCGEGIRSQQGNQVYEGGTITNCTTGFHLIGGGNDAHGTVTGMLINHNTTELLVDNATTNTEHFVNCAFYGAGTSINLVSSHNVFFDSDQIDVDHIYLDGSIGTVWRGNTWPNAAGTNIIHNSYNSHPSTTFADGWNVDLNGNASSIVAAAGWGWSPKPGVSAVVFSSDANKTASAADYSNDYLVVTSGVSLTATRNLVLPDSPGATFDVFNSTTGAQSVQFIGSSGTGVTVANGKRQRIRKDSTNYVAVTAAN